MGTEYHTLSISIHRVADAYQVELSHDNPQSRARVAPLRRTVTFDPEALLHWQHDPVEYGQALSRQLFSHEDLVQLLIQAEAVAQATEGFLRLLLCIDPTAQELQGLRWELLRHPRSNAALSTSETVLLSRFMVSRDWRPVKLRARAELRVLVAVAAPTPETLRPLRLAPVDWKGEVGRARAALAGIELRTLGEPGSPVTLDRLLDELREGVDILYLVCHGIFGRRTGMPALVLEGDAGEAAVVSAEELGSGIEGLQRGPRLVVLASCHSGGDGESTGTGPSTTPHATVATRLADAGVPGVVAMQGLITMQTVETMMPTFFTELLRDGQLDRALAVARRRIQTRDDFWVPALYCRLDDGRLWYTPGFRGDGGQDVWRRLLRPVAGGKVVPIIGPRLLETAHGASHDTAMRLAGSHRYPLEIHEWNDLALVTEYMSVKESRYNVVRDYQDQLLNDLLEQHRSWLPPEEIPPAVDKPRLGRLLALVGEHLRADPNDPHRILAELPASVYVTVNFDPLLEWALKANGRSPQQLLTRWRHRRGPPSVDKQASTRPSAQSPLVFHAFGTFGAETEDGLVLTQDDYFDYLIQATAARLIPARVESALVDNSLLFLGFRLTDWHFRVLFRLMMSLPGRERLKQYCHVAVQLDPDMQRMVDVEGAKAYLAEYFGKEANIDIYWGSPEDFLVALRDELAAAGDLSVEDRPRSDGEWDF